jgi:hypothetical protein
MDLAASLEKLFRTELDGLLLVLDNDGDGAKRR